jgi:hypothetical protein
VSAREGTIDDDRYTVVDIDIPLPEIWTFSELGTDERTEAETELTTMLADKVDDPAAVATASVDEFMERIGGGSQPLLLGSFREEMDDGSILSASLIVSKNELSGSLDPWRNAYPDAVEVAVMDEVALRTFEQSKVQMPELFDEPLTVCTWRYLVPFDERSILMFTFSSPNHELTEELEDHFGDIMNDVGITANAPA